MFKVMLRVQVILFLSFLSLSVALGHTKFGFTGQATSPELSLIHELKHEIAKLTLKNDDMEKRLKHQEVAFDQLAAYIPLGPRPRRPDVTLPVSFSFLRDPRKPDYKTIVFNYGLNNKGNGFDKESGVFTVPISGVYMFSFFLAEHEVGTYVATLTVDGEVISMAGEDITERGVSEIGGNVAVLEVYKDQKVKLGTENVGTYSSFSGFLLYVS